ncbi:thermonuclease family protein [Phyllobacterium endophyticum]|uniref:thermonuclease family protein n=1 Tax=Phyllobacterium endophyticum TaxID=1149773 RepID=UPI0011CAF70B|nr:thermonuclease family protein [Phyllobacterium endophyticum]TXR50078.1 thermonuclease family protein [Phyllobacterium endophyticum]
MSDRPRLVVDNQTSKKRLSPWQSDPSWLDKLKRERPRRRWQQRLQFALALLVLGATVILGGFGSHFHMHSGVQGTQPPTSQFLAGPSLYVVDGDTIHYNGEKIRIANIDTPEISQAKCESELKRGLEAKAALKELVDGRPLIIDRGDPHTGRMTDQYGRTLALVSTGGRDVGTILIQQRHARPWAARRMPWC